MIGDLNTLSRVVHEYLKIRPSGFDEIRDIVNIYNGKDWKKYAKFSKKGYKKNLVFRNEKFDVFIICWGSKQGTEIHDHADNGCVFKILKGEISQDLYTVETKKFIKTETLSIDSTQYICNKTFYHRMYNDSENKATSLHIYSPPNYKFNTINIEKN